jgi:hypothetical protein
MKLLDICGCGTLPSAPQDNINVHPSDKGSSNNHRPIVKPQRMLTSRLLRM